MKSLRSDLKHKQLSGVSEALNVSYSTRMPVLREVRNPAEDQLLELVILPARRRIITHVRSTQ